MDYSKIRFIGRYIYKNGKAYFAYSGCGFEMALLVKSPNASISFSFISELREHDSQYVAIYVNDSFYQKEKLIEGLNNVTLDLKGQEGRISIKVIKLNEVYVSSIYLSDITLINAELDEKPLSNKPLIGFFGDSLTCGFGLDDFRGEVFKMESEDFTKTYANLASFSLNMDYSVVARSGISVGIKIWVDQLFEEIYDTVDMFEKCDHIDKVDYAVINLGTNDCSAYLSVVEDKEAALKTFNEKFVSLVTRIIKDNPGVKILICHSMVEIDKVIVNAINEVGEYISKDYSNTCKVIGFEPNSDGAASHPYKTAHEEFAKVLVNAIEELK